MRRRRARTAREPGMNQTWTPATGSSAARKRATILEGTGGDGGVVLPLKMIGDGSQWSAYTVVMAVGSSRKEYDVLVDTASSDLWLASGRCGSQVCNAAHSRLYDQSSAQTTNIDVGVTYLVGSVHGPVVWDSVDLGGYQIPTQALISAVDVQNESLSAGFSGILGLALESNSQISEEIPSVITDDPDGAPTWSNMWGAVPMVPRFFSFILERPGFKSTSSVMGIGLHPSSVADSVDNINFHSIIPGESASAYWRLGVAALTVYVDGVARPIPLHPSTAVPRSSAPIAVFDTGGPMILASTAIANALYGAWGINPPLNTDGHFYMPCEMMLNVSVTIGRVEYPIHPMDASYKANPSDKGCIGTIVASDYLGQDGTAGDIILGVPFLRNIYTVLSFSEKVGEHEDDLLANPRLGLLSLTDPVKAVAEWKSVRVDGVPLQTSQPKPSSPVATSAGTVGKSGVDVGVIVGVVIVGFFGLCALLFLIWWFLVRRRIARDKAEAGDYPGPHDKDLALMLAGGRGSRYGSYHDTGTLNTSQDAFKDKSSRQGSAGDDLTLRSSRHSELYQLEAEPYQDARTPTVHSAVPFNWSGHDDDSGQHEYPPRRQSFGSAGTPPRRRTSSRGVPPAGSSPFHALEPIAASAEAESSDTHAH